MIDTIAEAGVSPLPAPTPATGKISSSVTTGRNDAVTVAAVDSSSAGMKPTLTVPSSSSSHTSKATNQKRSTKKKGGRTAGSSASASAAAASPEKKLTHLVIDSGAIIKGAGMTLASAAESFWTVPEVVAEIRDKKARHHLESLPFELKLREPSDEAMKFAAGFARQTGDLRSLSRVDLRVIALTYMLEKQETGASHLRTGPVRAGTRVNSNRKGVATPALAPEKEVEGTPAKILEPPQPSAVVAASSSEHLDEEKEVAEGKQEAGVESLCAAVKKAWTEEVVVATTGDVEKGANDDGTGVDEEKGGERGEGNQMEIDEKEGGSDREDREEQDEGDTEDEEEVSGGDDEEDNSSDNDDEWEPEGNSVSQDRNSHASSSSSAGEKATEKNVAFTADDFPTLGGNSATTPASIAPLPKNHQTKEETSWSLMARSNPAPFKIPAKVDPAPLPAAAAPVTPNDSKSDHFSSAVVASSTPLPRPDGAKSGTSRILSTAAAFGVSGGGAEDDDGEGWVNPSNIKSQKVAGIGLNGPAQSQKKGARSGGAATVSSKCRVGCVTTDFAMQNVILQVGLPLLSLDGMAVRRVKQWILRCAACFKTCTEMGRLFCPVCGNASLDRVSCSVNAKTGATYLHLRKNHKVNLRGSKFSIPAPDPTKGRFEGDLLLREDQLLSGIWAQKTRRKEKDVSSMFGEDITGNVGLTVSRSADIVVGYGRKNPNATRGRERRGKKGVKKRL